MESASILVVDDEPGIALLCKRVLSRAGYLPVCTAARVGEHTVHAE
jgi:CheY-like chemotaxis protein